MARFLTCQNYIYFFVINLLFQKIINQVKLSFKTSHFQYANE